MLLPDRVGLEVTKDREEDLLEQRVRRENGDRAVEHAVGAAIVELRERGGEGFAEARDRHAVQGARAPIRLRDAAGPPGGLRRGEPALDQVLHASQHRLVALAVEAVAGLAASRRGDSVAAFPGAQGRGRDAGAARQLADPDEGPGRGLAELLATAFLA